MVIGFMMLLRISVIEINSQILGGKKELGQQRSHTCTIVPKAVTPKEMGLVN